MKVVKAIAMVFVIIGGINWGLVGLFGIDLIAEFFGYMTLLARMIYSFVGLAAILIAIPAGRCCK